MSDIKKFKVEATGRLALLDPQDNPMLDDKGAEMAIVFYGPGSKQYSKAQAAQNNRLTDLLKKKGKADQTAEQRKAGTSKFLADCTESFENIDYEKLQGEALYLAVFSDLELGFIADQSSAYLGDWSNFTKPSPSSLPSTSGK